MKKVTKRFILLFVIAASLSISSYTLSKKHKKVLVFSKTERFRHNVSIAVGKTTMLELGQKNEFDVDTTENANVFTANNLKQYETVVFLCTSGEVLNDEQQEAFQQFIRNGGGYVGLHSSADTEYNWPWFGELNGAYFKNHPKQQDAVFNVINTNHPSTAHLPKVWKRFDELYNFKWIGNDLNVLITIDENSYSGGTHGEKHPIAWYHDFDGGRSFYTAMGHDNKSWDDPTYVQHVLGGIQYALGVKATKIK